MATVLDPAPPAAPTPPPVRWRTMGDLLRDLVEIPADRVRMNPLPGHATLTDLVAAKERRDGPVCEWVDGTLVEKAMGFHESNLTAFIVIEIGVFLRQHDIGTLTVPDGVMKILPKIGRGPDVAFLSWARFPGEKLPPRGDKVPALVPDLAIEVLSESNTKREMARKRREYFLAGVTVVWEIDPKARAANVYTGPDDVTPRAGGRHPRRRHRVARVYPVAA